jgi:hypothetical protein
MTKMKQLQILKGLLYVGAVYFSGVAIVHSLGVKVPGLFIYYNVPSHAYQDRIISFLALGWAAFFYLTARKMDADFIKLILMIGFIAMLALTANSIITDFRFLNPLARKADFLLITSILFIYWGSLVFFSKQLLKKKK